MSDRPSHVEDFMGRNEDLEREEFDRKFVREFSEELSRRCSSKCDKKISLSRTSFLCPIVPCNTFQRLTDDVFRYRGNRNLESRVDVRQRKTWFEGRVFDPEKEKMEAR